MGSKLQVTPTKLQVTPTKLQVTLANLQVTPTKLQVTLVALTNSRWSTGFVPPGFGGLRDLYPFRVFNPRVFFTRCWVYTPLGSLTLGFFSPGAGSTGFVPLYLGF